MADDYASNASTTGRLAIGGTLSAVLDTSTDADWFAVQLTAGYSYEFDLSATTGFSGSAAPLGLALVNASGSTLAGGGTAKTLTYKPTSTGTYYLDAYGSNSTTGTGTYTLTSSAADDYTSDATTTGRLSPGGSLYAVQNTPFDIDWIAVSLQAGFNYQFNISATATGSAANLKIALVDANGTSLAGGYIVTNFTYNPSKSGTYYVDVYPNTGGAGVGTYLLTETNADDYSNNASTTGRLAIGANVTGRIESTGDADWFAVNLTAGVTYKFSLSPGADFIGGFSPQLALVNASGSDLNGGFGATSVTYTPTVSGTYYLDAFAGGGAGLGSYTITSLNANGTGAAGATSSIAVYRFFDSRTGTQFLTSDMNERNTVLATRPDLVNEGVGLSAVATADPNAASVFRFFDSTYGTHFFTSSTSERDTIQATRPDLVYEGVAFSEYMTAQPGSTPVYRFFESTNGTHFFTGSATERATILATRPDLVAEGISFYSPT